MYIPEIAYHVMCVFCGVYCSKNELIIYVFARMELIWPLMISTET